MSTNMDAYRIEHNIQIITKSIYDLEVTGEDISEGNEVFCSTFGCGKKLSLLETLCGNKCLSHAAK